MGVCRDGSGWDRGDDVMRQRASNAPVTLCGAAPPPTPSPPTPACCGCCSRDVRELERVRERHGMPGKRYGPFGSFATGMTIVPRPAVSSTHSRRNPT
eukprot:353618-Chlamydomonas_euryale.AAC.12